MSITRILAESISDYSNPKSLGSRLRAKRIAPLLGMIEATFNEYGFVNIIDVGGVETYWDIVPRQNIEKHHGSITIVNLPGIDMPTDHGCFTFVAADGCDLSCFADGEFHIAHSNSVLEHVGDWGQRVRFAKEISRVAPKYFVQTPNYLFPIEPHFMTPFFHWLPKIVRIWMVLHFQLGHYEKAESRDEAARAVDSVRLMKRGMFKELFKDAQILTERVFGVSKSFIAVKK